MLICTEPIRSQLLAASIPCPRHKKAEDEGAALCNRSDPELSTAAERPTLSRQRSASEQGLTSEGSTVAKRAQHSLGCFAAAEVDRQQLAARASNNCAAADYRDVLYEKGGAGPAADGVELPPGRQHCSRAAQEPTQPAATRSNAVRCSDATPGPQSAQTSFCGSAASVRSPQPLPPDTFSLQHKLDAQPHAPVRRDAGVLRVLLSSFQTPLPARPRTAPATRSPGTISTAAQQQGTASIRCRASISGGQGVRLQEEAAVKHTASGRSSGSFHARGWSRAQAYSSKVCPSLRWVARRLPVAPASSLVRRTPANACESGHRRSTTFVRAS